jgi:hypothetical protein
MKINELTTSQQTIVDDFITRNFTRMGAGQIATVWIGETTCDLCHIEGRRVPQEATIDCATYQGPWGKLCDGHFRGHGVGTGTGRGQILVPKAPKKEDIQ